MPDALLVDQDADHLRVLAELVARAGFKALTARSLDDARSVLSGSPVDVILSDSVLPDGSWTELLPHVGSARKPRLVLIGGDQPNGITASDAAPVDILDHLTKPVDAARLESLLSGLVRTLELKARSAPRTQPGFGRLVGASPSMRRVYDLIVRVAPSDVGVLICGDSGTGKELVAQTIHEFSRRSEQPFLAINGGAMSPHLVESELFGHERGSFTGALGRHRGHFERTSGGTLFLDEVTEMPLELQAKLLRVLETGATLRVGGDELVHTDVRIVAATNRPPLQAVREHRLRLDLYYRLNVFPIVLPPLRERPGDVSILAQHFLAALNEQETVPKRIGPEMLSRLEDYDWPGNVRQLRNVVHHAYIMAGESRVLRWSARALMDGETIRALGSSYRVGETLEDLRRRVILTTFAHYRSKRKTAEVLGISLKTLYNRLQLYERENADGAARSSSDPDE